MQIYSIRWPPGPLPVGPNKCAQARAYLLCVCTFVARTQRQTSLQSANKVAKSPTSSRNMTCKQLTCPLSLGGAIASHSYPILSEAMRFDMIKRPSGWARNKCPVSAFAPARIIYHTNNKTDSAVLWFASPTRSEWSLLDGKVRVESHLIAL